MLCANYIFELKYIELLSNVVLVKKMSSKWRMCVDYTSLNWACPIDSYPFPNIHNLVDNSIKYKLLSIMDAYSEYNQIPMHGGLIETKLHSWRVPPIIATMSRPFDLNNSCTTNQIIMNKIFEEEIKEILELYMDDMIIKSIKKEPYDNHLTRVLNRIR